MPDFLNIPGNIRQQYMPFTIKGSDAMQLFTFKEKMRKKDTKGGVAIIHPFSKHLGTLIQNDSSISYTHGPDGNKKVTYEQFLDEIPSLQIREFVPDAKLTQTFKWFSYLKKGFDAASKDLDSEAAGGWQNVKTKLESALRELSTTMKELTSGNAERLAKVVAGLTNFYQDRGFSVGGDKGLAVLWLPFILYYRLTTTHTNNIYEFPTSMQNNIFESDGTYGWGDDNGTDFPVLDVLGNKAQSLVGLVSSGLASTIKVNAMPAFSPTGSASATSFDVHIDLINDSEEAAINNFLFCHTLFGNNRWLQYGFVQTGASLYDVKFPGANRFFMCKGKFVCKGKGAFRTPSQNVIDGIVSHKHDKDNEGNSNTAANALNTPSIWQSLGRAEARNIFEANMQQMQQQTQQSRAVVAPSAVSDDVIKQIMKRGMDVKIESIETKNPNTVIAFRDGKIKPEVIEAKQTDYKTITDEIRRIESSVSETNNKRTTKLDIISNNNAKIDFNNKRIDSYKKEYSEWFDEDGNIKPEYKDSDVGKTINFLHEEINQLKEKNKDEQDWVNTYDSALLYNEKELRDEKQKIDDLFNSEELTPFAESLGADAVKNMVVSVSKDTWKNLIKIPDVYSLTLTFSSLIPDNFNNYLYGWRAGNLDPIDNYFLGEVIEKGVMEKLVDNLIEAVGKG